MKSEKEKRSQIKIEDGLMTSQETADYLAVSRSTIYKKIKFILTPVKPYPGCRLVNFYRNEVINYRKQLIESSRQQRIEDENKFQVVG